MNKRSKFLVLRYLLIILAPALIFFAVDRISDHILNLQIVLIVAYAVTLGWIVFVTVKKLCSPTYLPLSFLVSPVITSLYERTQDDAFAHIGSTVIYFAYGLPWALITFVVAVVLIIVARVRHRKEAQNYELYSEED